MVGQVLYLGELRWCQLLKVVGLESLGGRDVEGAAEVTLDGHRCAAIDVNVAEVIVQTVQRLEEAL